MRSSSGYAVFDVTSSGPRPYDSISLKYARWAGGGGGHWSSSWAPISSSCPRSRRPPSVDFTGAEKRGRGRGLWFGRRGYAARPAGAPSGPVRSSASWSTSAWAAFLGLHRGYRRFLKIYAERCVVRCVVLCASSPNVPRAPTRWLGGMFSGLAGRRPSRRGPAVPPPPAPGRTDKSRRRDMWPRGTRRATR